MYSLVYFDKIGERSDNRRPIKFRIVQTSQDSLSAGAQSGAFFVQLLQYLQFGLALRQGPLIRAEVAVDLLQFLLRMGKFVLAVVQFVPAGLHSGLGQFKLVPRVRDQVVQADSGSLLSALILAAGVPVSFHRLPFDSAYWRDRRGALRSGFPAAGSDVENLERIVRHPVAAIGVDSLDFAAPRAVVLPC